MRRLPWLLSLAAALSFSFLSSNALADIISGFTEKVSPDAETNATEPSVAVDRSDGTIYVAWQASGTWVARSDDGGRAFVQTPIADFFGRDIGDVHTRVGGPTGFQSCLPPRQAFARFSMRRGSRPITL